MKLIAILKESAPKGGIALAELADRLAMDARTIRRDLTCLVKSEELPIKKKTEAHGRLLYWLDESPLTPSTFKYDEAAALYLGRSNLFV